MNTMVAEWRHDYGQGLDLSRLRERYSPPDRFRVSEYVYPTGTETTSSMLAGKCFVLAGTLVFEFPTFEVTVRQGEFADLPQGTHQLRVVGEQDAKLIFVWEIPTE
jgi:mannose-6-phosphate isomerase-like protein (cupin superfamily)